VRARQFGLAIVALLPSALKIPLYRVAYGYRIGPRVRIGISLLDGDEVDLAEGTQIGHLNAIVRVGRFQTGREVRIGVLNVFRGGESVAIADYSTIIRLNVINAIPDHDCTTEPRSTVQLGAGTVITSGHRIDFTDRVVLGRNVIVGGRGSSLWTHNRQETAPIEVGDFCYLGSEVRLAPGAKLPAECVLGIGAVLVGEIRQPRSLVAGVPARVVRPLHENDLARIRRKTRRDMPDGFYDRE
jgi:acetyltransferase-like isoleucine patch superfamily enzyme